MAYPDFTPEELATEEWRGVVGYETFYHVSSLGRVKRIKEGRGSARVGRILKPNIVRGYCRVTLRTNKPSISPKIHKLVAAAFIGPCPEGMEVNHKDTVTSNNRETNLEYLTHKQNQEHAALMGRYKTGKNNKKTKLQETDIPVIWGLIESGIKDPTIAKQFRVDAGAIRNIRRGISWRQVLATHITSRS